MISTGLLDWLNPSDPITDMALIAVSWLVVVALILIGLSNLFVPRWFPRPVAALMVIGAGAYAWLYLM